MKSTYLKRWNHERKPRHGKKLRREQKRLEAEERQRYWNTLAVSEKLRIIHFRRGQSTQEVNKLLNRQAPAA